jgi:wyosine [tRNA(Phe)-imidazoG37] synthetase (radical SAM superfamily)
MKTEFVAICGAGEPFLHPDIKKMLSLTVKYRFKAHIISNGIHIDSEMLDYMLRIKLERLTLSIHAGNNKTYRAIHPLVEEELFNLLKEKLVYLKMKKDKLKSRYPKITIINVISRLNYGNLSDMIGFAQKVCADRICFKPLNVRDETKKTLSLKQQHINRIKADLKNLGKNIKLEHNIEEFLNNITVLDERINQGNRMTKNRMCYLPWVRTNITTEGKVIGCLYQADSCLGYITKTPFREIWNSKEYTEFRRNRLCPENCFGAAVYPFVNIINRINRVKNRLKLRNRRLSNRIK